MKRIILFCNLFLISFFCFAQQNLPARIIGGIPSDSIGKKYQIQVGAYKIEKNAEDAVLQLRNIDLQPATERFRDFTRVLIKDIPANQVRIYLATIAKAGFMEVIIREDTPSVSFIQSASRSQAQPVSPLPPPEIVRPAAGKRYGPEELMTLKNIVFEWKTVKGANAYIFTLYQQTERGRRQITGTSPSAGTNCVLDNLKVLENGTFIWQVEAVSLRRDGTIERRGRPGEYSFVLDYPPPEPVQIEDTGILYGN